MDNKDKRYDYLKECFINARIELLERTKRRDNWIKLQLFSQAIIFALAYGIEIQGVKHSNPLPNIILISPLVSLIIISSYGVEDRIIGLLSKYVGKLSLKEKELNHGEDIINNWDVSEELKQYSKEVRPLRNFTAIISFISIPVVLLLFRFNELENWTLFNYSEIIFNILVIVTMIIILLKGIKQREKTGYIELKTENSNLIKSV